MERTVTIALEATNELGDKVARTLVLEAMGRHADLLLLDGEGRIIDCTRKVEGDLASGTRQLLPGLFYRAPEPRFGIPPLIERELRFRGEEGELSGAIQTMWDTVKEYPSTPVMLVRDGRPADFSFLPILQYGPETESREYPSFGALLDEFYAAKEQTERVRRRGDDLLRTVRSARERTARKLENQRLELMATQDRERLRELGDILTTNLHLLERGRATVKLQDYYDPGMNEVEIRLDPLLPPQQNAAKYYKDYNKAKNAEAALTVQIEKGEGDLAYLDSVLEALTLAEGERDIQEIRQELTDSGYLKKKGGKGKEKRVAGKTMEFRTDGGLRVSVGKNNTQNDQLTTKKAGKWDWWFHTQKIHGSHVILWTEGGEPDEVSVAQAAALAAWFSQGREAGKVPVDYTQVRYVKKPAGARPGMVVYTTYQTMMAEPDEALAKRLRVK